MPYWVFKKRIKQLIDMQKREDESMKEAKGKK